MIGVSRPALYRFEKTNSFSSIVASLTVWQTWLITR